MNVLLELAAAGALTYLVARRFTGRPSRRDRAERNRLYQLRCMPVTPIARLQAGRLSKIRGQLKPLGPLGQAPISQEACVLYVARVCLGLSGSDEELVCLETRADFAVVDASGEIPVRPQGAFLLLYPTYLHQCRNAADNDNAHEVAALLERHHRVPGASIIEREPFLYSEAVLKPGDTLEVMGRTVVEPDPRSDAMHGYRDSAERLVFAHRDPTDGEMVVSSYSPHLVEPVRVPGRPLSREMLDALIGRP